MDKKIYLNEYRNTIKANNILKFTLFSLVLIIFIEGFFIVYALNSKQTIVIPNVKARYVISDDKANIEYIKQMAYYLTNLVENFTPHTIKKNYDEFLNFVTPQEYGRVQAAMLGVEENYITADASSWFNIKNVKIYPNKVEVDGVKTIIIGDKVTSSKHLLITITYKIKHGTFEVINYEEKKFKQSFVKQ